MGIVKAPSQRSLDTPQLTPSRLLSPDRKKTLNHPFESSDSETDSKRHRRSLLVSPEEVEGIIEISDQLKDLLQTLPPGANGNKQLMVEFDVETPKKPSSSRKSSIGSLDTVPTMPSRTQSPRGERGFIQMSRGHLELLEPLLTSPREENTLISSMESKLADSNQVQSLEADKEIFETSGQARDFSVDVLSISTTASPPVVTAFLVGESEMDFREVVLSRMPNDIKNRLSVEEWYRILEPPVYKEGSGGHSVCSDLTTDDWRL